MMTVMPNGVVAHHAVAFHHPSQEWSFSLQDHHTAVRYRNIWVRPLHGRDESLKK